MRNVSKRLCFKPFWFHTLRTKLHMTKCSEKKKTFHLRFWWVCYLRVVIVDNSSLRCELNWVIIVLWKCCFNLSRNYLKIPCVLHFISEGNQLCQLASLLVTLELPDRNRNFNNKFHVISHCETSPITNSSAVPFFSNIINKDL